jgi:MFS family permease
LRIPAFAKLVLVILSLGILFSPGIQHHWQLAHDPYFVPFDAVQYIPSYFKYDPKEPIPTTYIKEYYLNVTCPILYRWLTRVGAQLTDVRHSQLALTYLLYALFIIILGRIGWVLGGAALSFAVMAFSLEAWIFFGLGFIGGAPRIFAYPLISLILYSLIRDRPNLLAVTVVFGGLLYPIVAMLGGISLAGWLLLKPFAGNSVVSRWSIFRRLATVVVTGLLTLAALLPLMLASKLYGRHVIAGDIATYPEAGSEGNYRPYDRLPFELLGNEWIVYYIGPLLSHGDPIVSSINVHKQFEPGNALGVIAVSGLVIFVIILGGARVLLKSKHRGMALRIAGFFLGCILLHALAWLFAPYFFIPTRYFMFTLPFLIALIFPWALFALLAHSPQLQAAPKIRTAVFLGIVSLYLLLFGGRGNVDFSESVVKKSAQPLFAAVAALPTDAVVAGWPLGELRKMEYVTRRNVFLTGDVHQVLYLDCLKKMRERMDAMFDAYLSTDAAPIARLKQEYGVTHLLVETRDFSGPDQVPEYFAPWRERIAPRLAEIKGKEYLMNEALQKKAAVFNQDGLILLDLAKLP